jgi:hypothetical protein
MTIRFLSSCHPCTCGGRVHYPTDSITVDAGDERITVALYDAPWCDRCGDLTWNALKRVRMCTNESLGSSLGP